MKVLRKIEETKEEFYQWRGEEEEEKKNVCKDRRFAGKEKRKRKSHT